MLFRSLSPMAPLIWFDNPLLTDKLYLKLDPLGNYLFGSVTVNNDLTVFRTTYLCNTVTIGNDIVSADTFMNGNLNVGTSSAPKNINLYGNIYRNGVLFNGNVISNTIPTGGFSLVNSNNTIKCIIPGNNITITNTSGNLTIGLSSGSQAVLNNSAAAWSSGLSSDYYHYISSGTGALVIRDSSGNVSANFIGSSGGASNAGNALFYKNVILFSNLYFGDPQSGGQSFDQKVSTIVQNTIGSNIFPIYPLMWNLDLANPNNLNLALDPNASYQFGGVTISGDTVMGGNLTVGNSTAPTNLTVYGNIINPFFGGTITGLTKSNVGLGNVDNKIGRAHV